MKTLKKLVNLLLVNDDNGVKWLLKTPYKNY